VKDSHYNGIREAPRPVLYRPIFQHGSKQAYRWGFVSFEVRSASIHPEDIRAAVESLDRNLPVFRMNTLRAQTEQSLTKERLLAALSGFFGALALLVSCVGLYGLMAYAVAQRVAEIGIRMALGARGGSIAWMVVREALLLAVAGIAAGIPLALWAGRYAKSQLFEIKASDPVSIAIAVAALLVVAAVAAWAPARRAIRVDPMTALRCL
jgi:ABC-type antimicrobial peptide transport system permease subunit